MEHDEELMQRVARLEEESRLWRARYEAQVGAKQAGRRRRLPRRRVFTSLVLLVLCASGVAYAQLTQFQPGTPAAAAAVNANFNQLKAWLEAKVGTVGAADLTLTNDANVRGVGIVEGYNDLTLRGQPGNGSDVYIAPNGNVSVASSLSVAGREVGRRGVTFTRWGAQACPGGTSQVYSGLIGGGFYTHTGGASSLLCMHGTPEYNQTTAGFQDGAVMYKVEFETSLGALPSLSAVHDDDARCAVCEAPRDQVLMIPGRRSCPSGWTEEYEGYLMTERYNHEHQSDVLCVDASPSAGLNTGNENGSLLYPVEAGVPTIQGYTANNELTCVVCTK